MEELKTLALDNGNVRAGFWGNEGRWAVVPNIVGRSLSADAGPSQYLVGHDLIEKRGYSRQRPMEKGIVVNWDHMEMVWNRVLADDFLSAGDLHQYGVVLTDVTFSPKSQREKMTQIMFETFDVPALRIIDHAVSSLNFIQMRTGLVVDMGWESIRVVPVHNGHALANIGMELSYGGEALTDYMAMLLSTSSGRTAREAKEKCCYIALDYERELRKAQKDPQSVEKIFELPDMSDILTIGSARFQCPEALFKPSMIGRTDPSLHQAIYDVLMKVSPDIRLEIANSISVGGMPSMFLGLRDRLDAELKKLMPNQKFRVMVAPGSHLASYLGATNVDPGRYDKQNFITKQQFDEEGLQPVHRLFINKI